MTNMECRTDNGHAPFDRSRTNLNRISLAGVDGILDRGGPSDSGQPSDGIVADRRFLPDSAPDGIILLVFSHASSPRVGFRLWSLNPFILGLAVILTVAGLSFAVSARFHLGKYWSGRITLKVDHR